MARNHIMSKDSSSFLNNRVITRGAKQGYCRICKQYGDLTRDHIPPKGSIEITSVELRTLAQDKDIKPVISQDGTNFRTICGNCNNKLLGTEYDPELNKVSNKVGSTVKQVCSLSHRGISLPPKVSIEVKPQRLARAVVGHLLASNYHPDPSDISKNVPFPEALRQFFLDPKSTLPDELNIYYWYYPGKRQVLLHGASMGFFNNTREPLIYSLIKFFPISYWMTWEQPKHISMNAPKLLENRNLGIDDVETIQIELLNYPRIDFPENPSDDDEIQYLLFFNSQLSSVATKKKDKKRKGFGK